MEYHFRTVTLRPILDLTTALQGPEPMSNVNRNPGSHEYFWFALALIAVLVGYAAVVPEARGPLSADQTSTPIEPR
jgi:hypothetical protein